MPAYIQKNILLTPYTTLGIGGFAEYFVEVTNEKELREVVQWAKDKKHPLTILGGGSNVLISDEGVKGLVLRPLFSGITYREEGEFVLVTVGAGVLLDTFIAEVVEKELWGIENLSAIPGTVGATPIQNVGAYGVEVSDVIKHISVFDCVTEKIFEIKKSECMFAYRNSIFKKQEGKKYIILDVTFQLQKKATPQISYKDLALYFQDNFTPTLFEIRNAVIDIRSKKFPNWYVDGTAGSFFKNPIISIHQYIQLQQKYPAIPGYNTENGMVKIALGWILEHVCNLKGYTEGHVGLFKNQALVLVCTKDATAEEVKIFSEKIIQKVFLKTGIVVEREVTII